MAKAKVVFACANGRHGDAVEQATSYWAQNAYRKLRRKRRTFYGFCLVREVTRTRLAAALTPIRRVRLLVLWGHGRRSDGAYLSANHHTVLDRRLRDLRLLIETSVCALYCYSEKLYRSGTKLLKPREAPPFVGFEDAMYVIVRPCNTSYMGFEEASEKAWSAILNGYSGAFAAQRFRKECAKWATYWGCNILLSAFDRHWDDAATSLFCTLAFLNNMDEVRGHN